MTMKTSQEVIKLRAILAKDISQLSNSEVKLSWATHLKKSRRSHEGLTSYRRPIGSTLKTWPSIRCTRWGPCLMSSRVVPESSNLMQRAKSHHLNCDTKIRTVARRLFKSWSNSGESPKNNTSNRKTWIRKTRLLCPMLTYCQKQLSVHKMGSPMSQKASRQAALKQAPFKLSLLRNIKSKDREHLVLKLKIQSASLRSQKQIICYLCWRISARNWQTFLISWINLNNRYRCLK